MPNPCAPAPLDSTSVCVGLFGTCGTTTWRQQFIETYTNLEIAYYNPQVKEWTPEFALVEADHLLHDDIVLFAVTAQTYSTGSLAETGYALQVLKRIDYMRGHRRVIVYIEQGLDLELVRENPIAAKESMRARALVAAHVGKVKETHCYVVNSMPEMLMLSIQLYPAVAAMKKANEAVHAAQVWLDQIRSEHNIRVLTK